MKIAKKLVINVSLVLMSVLFFYYICIVFTPKDINAEGGRTYYEGKGFMAEPENTLDILMLGNSSVYSGFSPNRLFMEYGYTSFASGYGMQTINGVNYFLKKALKKQKPKLIILEVDCLYFYSSIAYNKYSMLGSPIRYNYRWKTLKFKDFYTYPSLTKNVDFLKGYVFNDTEVDVTNYGNYMGNSNDKPLEIRKENLRQLNRFFRTCKQNDIELMFLEITNINSWNYSKHNKIAQIAEERGITFFDYNVNPEKSIGFDFSKDFRDNGKHLNINGAEKTTLAVGKYIKEHYGDRLSDRRNDDKYSNWKESVEKYKRLKK